MTVDEGRMDLVELDAAHSTTKTGLINDDLAPMPVKGRTWHTYNFAALWMSIAHGIPTYYLASGLIGLGMSWWQAVGIIGLGNLIVMVPLLLNSHAGAKYGIPFPVFARTAFGVKGANIPALVRALSACGWFGIQTWVGGQAIYTLSGVFFGAGWSHAETVAGHPWTMWLSFAIFWAIQMGLILGGIESIRKLENFAAPLILIVAAILLFWVVSLAGGLGQAAVAPSKVGWGPDFWRIFPGALMGMIAYYSTMAVNISDFTRFAKSQRAHIVGQSVGLVPTVVLFTTIGALTTSATAEVWGKAIWDPIELVGKIPSPIVVLFSMLCVIVATVAVNVAANTVGPAYDFAHAFPRLISFKAGGIITGVIAILMQPWNLLASSDLYIFVWLGITGAFLGSVAGIMVADYWIIRRTSINLADVYRRRGIYEYANGVNWRAVVSMAVALLLSTGGAYSAPDTGGPFPVQGFIPILKPLYDYNWVVAFLTGLALHLVLARLFPQRPPASAPGPEATPIPASEGSAR